MNTQTKKTCRCQTKGLAILPVRYTVVPTYLERTKPNWVNLPSVINVPLSEKYQYHVRRLREGYLYVYLPAEIGDDKWQIYTIDNQGHLFKQQSNLTAKSPSEIKESGEYNCPQLVKNSSHNSFITVVYPQYQQKIYIAYSEFIWSEFMLKQHEQSPEKRMQLIEPSQWAEGQSSNQSATAATQQNIEQILDYDPTFDQKQLPYDHHMVEADLVLYEKNKLTSKSNYTDTLSYDKTGINGDKSQAYGFDDKVFDRNTTCHPWTKQQDQAQSLTHTMTRYSEGYTPIIFAIDDSLGIAQELNGYFTEIFAKDGQYRQERELEFNAKESYDYAMQILIQKEWFEDFKYSFTEHPYLKRVIKTKKIERSTESPIFSTYNQLSVMIYQQLYGRVGSGDFVRQMEVFDNFAGNVAYESYADIYTLERSQFLYGNDLNKYDAVGKIAYLRVANNYNNLSLVPKIQKQIDIIDGIEYKVDDLMMRYTSREKKLEVDRETKIVDMQKKYSKHMNTKNFDEKHESLTTKISETAEIRATQLISWIKQSNFYFHLQDLDGDQWVEIDVQDEKIKAELDNQFEIDCALSDNEITEEETEELKKVNLYGLVYSNVVERTIAGLELTQIGKEQVEQWFRLEHINQNNSDSLMWRGVANNSDQIRFEIQQLLENAQSIDIEVNIDEVYTATKPGKLAAYYKKTQSFINAVNNYKKELGTTTPRENRLLKLLLSKPALAVNNLILRLSNTIFIPVNLVLQIPNAALSYLFHFALCGIPKSVSISFIRSQSAMNHHILSSPLQTKVSLPGGVVGELTGTARKKILERNAKFLRIKKIYYNDIKQILNETYRNNIQKTLTDSFGKTLSETDMWREEAKDIARSAKSPLKPANAIKDARLALIIGLFEVHNWWQLKQKQADLGIDEF